MKADFKKYTLYFKRPAGTSRGVMQSRDSYFIFIKDKNKTGIGEIAPLKNLSCDANPGLEPKITEVCRNIQDYDYWIEEGLVDFPSVRFGLETAMLDLNAVEDKILFPSDFTMGQFGIPINGLIWMGEPEYMIEQINTKINDGFRCIKLKIGAIDFDKELTILQSIRKRFSAKELEIRVDANGAFSMEEARENLQKLAALQIHSIEQPIAAGKNKELADLCRNRIMPIALDESLIGVHKMKDKTELLSAIRPDYIILKPSLHGGIVGCTEWIQITKSLNIGWWITSALESNVGLNAIAQWTATLGNSLPQGLGTGSLFTNNFPSPLIILDARLFYQPKEHWNLSILHDE